MSQKTYQRWRLGIVFVLAMAISQSIVFNNYVIPLMLLIVASLILWYLRSRVKEIIADERDYALGGKAALLAIQIFGWLAVVGMFALYSQKGLNPMYEVIGTTLSYSVLFLFLVYGLIYRYYSRFKFKNNVLYLMAAILVVMMMTVFSIRLFSGEDNWICKDGTWQKHGQPNFPAPTTECK